FFFFFQAEDGIRDFHVTGVQTCALPISCLRGRRCRQRAHRPGRRHRDTRERAYPGERLRPLAPFGRSVAEYFGNRRFPDQRLARSEERRVGKECSPRWWRAQYKENKRIG